MTNTQLSTEHAGKLSVVTGYDTELRFYATRYKQGGRTVFSLDLSLLQIEALIPKPDPKVLTPGNRAIRANHADEFAKYLIERKDWVAPGMILRSPSIFKFDVLQEVEGAEFGIMTFARRDAKDIHILDGQHRTLGIYLAQEKVAEEIDRARSALAKVRRAAVDGNAEADMRERIAELERVRDRITNERISVQIYLEEDATAYKQMFFDIADNALGITSSVKARFDNRKVVNRALEQVLEHPLLLNRVDPEADRIRNSPYLMGAKHVAEMVRSVQVGLDGRVSRRQEAEFNENDVAAKVKRFLDIVVEAFPPFQAMLAGQIMPNDLRKTSLLGSVLFVRILAGVYHDLTDEHAFTDEMVRDYFKKLAPHTAGPAHINSIWVEHLPQGIFPEGGYSTTGRRQDLKELKSALVEWAIIKPPFLDEDPVPAPEPEDPKVLIEAEPTLKERAQLAAMRR